MAQNYYIDPDYGSDTNDGLSWDTCVKTIDAARELGGWSGGILFLSAGKRHLSEYSQFHVDVTFEALDYGVNPGTPPSENAIIYPDSGLRYLNNFSCYCFKAKNITFDGEGRLKNHFVARGDLGTASHKYYAFYNCEFKGFETVLDYHELPPLYPFRYYNCTFYEGSNSIIKLNQCSAIFDDCTFLMRNNSMGTHSIWFLNGRKTEQVFNRCYFLYLGDIEERKPWVDIFLDGLGSEDKVTFDRCLFYQIYNIASSPSNEGGVEVCNSIMYRMFSRYISQTRSYYPVDVPMDLSFSCFYESPDYDGRYGGEFGDMTVINEGPMVFEADPRIYLQKDGSFILGCDSPCIGTGDPSHPDSTEYAINIGPIEASLTTREINMENYLEYLTPSVHRKKTEGSNLQGFLGAIGEELTKMRTAIRTLRARIFTKSLLLVDNEDGVLNDYYLTSDQRGIDLDQHGYGRGIFRRKGENNSSFESRVLTLPHRNRYLGTAIGINEAVESFYEFEEDRALEVETIGEFNCDQTRWRLESERDLNKRTWYDKSHTFAEVDYLPYLYAKYYVMDSFDDWIINGKADITITPNQPDNSGGTTATRVHYTHDENTTYYEYNFPQNFNANRSISWMFEVQNNGSTDVSFRIISTEDGTINDSTIVTASSGWENVFLKTTSTEISSYKLQIFNNSTTTSNEVDVTIMPMRIEVGNNSIYSNWTEIDGCTRELNYGDFPTFMNLVLTGGTDDVKLEYLTDSIYPRVPVTWRGSAQVSGNNLTLKLMASSSSGSDEMIDAVEIPADGLLHDFELTLVSSEAETYKLQMISTGDVDLKLTPWEFETGLMIHPYHRQMSLYELRDFSRDFQFYIRIAHKNNSVSIAEKDREAICNLINNIKPAHTLANIEFV